MANQLGSQTTAPREYNAHQRRSKLSRRRHDDQQAAFIAQIVTKLSSSTAVIFAKIAKYGAARVKAATNISQLP